MDQGRRHHPSNTAANKTQSLLTAAVGVRRKRENHGILQQPEESPLRSPIQRLRCVKGGVEPPLCAGAALSEAKRGRSTAGQAAATRAMAPNILRDIVFFSCTGGLVLLSTPTAKAHASGGSLCGGIRVADRPPWPGPRRSSARSGRRSPRRG